MKRRITIFFIFFTVYSFSQNKTEEYIAKYKEIAINEMKQFNIPASITLAQGILESGNGESRLAISANNHFGIKCHSNWKGKKVYADDDKKQECFRKYKNASSSYRDHSLFLNNNNRYQDLFSYSKTDYKSWSKGLQKAGYATNPKYSELLIDLIEKYNLDQYDLIDSLKRKGYISHVYGLPYLVGFGLNYIEDNAIYHIQIQSLFLFSGIDVAYSPRLYHNTYIGLSTGLNFTTYPFGELTSIPHIALSTTFKKSIKSSVYNYRLARLGLKYLIKDELKFKILPFIEFSYLF